MVLMMSGWSEAAATKELTSLVFSMENCGFFSASTPRALRRRVTPFQPRYVRRVQVMATLDYPRLVA